jgi:hypothetical protein
MLNDEVSSVTHDDNEVQGLEGRCCLDHVPEKGSARD